MFSGHPCGHGGVVVRDKTGEAPVRGSRGFGVLRLVISWPVRKGFSGCYYYYYCSSSVERFEEKKKKRGVVFEQNKQTISTNDVMMQHLQP